jgi:hypothetical protein
MFMLFEFALLSFGFPMLKLLTSDVDFLEGLEPFALAIVAGLI